MEHPITQSMEAFLKLHIVHNTSLAVAVSGGGDSMALLRILSMLSRAYNLKLTALTVDHGLRTASTQEAQDVGAFCKNFEIPHHVLTWQGEKPKTRLQERARTMRYHLLCEFVKAHNISSLCLAHHQDDQMETFFMRLFKGSGVHGLRGMDPVSVQGGVTILRPFLNMKKESLQKYCHSHNVPTLHDPSNDNEHFERVRVRKWLTSLPKEHIHGALSSMEHLRQSDTCMEEILDQTQLHIVEKWGISHSRLFDLSSYIRLLVMRRFLHKELGSLYPPRYEKVEKLLYALEHKKTHTLLGYVWKVRQGYVVWVRESE